jgi:hypothetical protein
MFPSSREARETPTVLNPLERANLSPVTGSEALTLLGPLERTGLNPETGSLRKS